VLQSGIKVNKYIYVDIDPTARKVAEFRLANLSARFPHLLEPHTWADAFTLLQDLNSINSSHLDQVLVLVLMHVYIFFHVIAMYGVPAEVISDNGGAFKGEFHEMLERFHIHHRYITHDFPQSNGLAEHMVQT
jgi:hypothetical protein